jgi:hypothetical protein
MRTAALLAAFVLTALATPAEAAEPQAPGDGLSRASAAFTGLGIVGTGAIGVGTMHYLGQGGTPWAGLLAIPAAGLLHYGLGHVLDVRVTAASVTEGALLGALTAGAGFLLGRLAGQALERRDPLEIAVIGLVVGGAVGTPVWTLLDPLGLAANGSPALAPGGSAGDGPVFRSECDRVLAR